MARSCAVPLSAVGKAKVTTIEALSPDRIPKKLVVVGGGYIGLELGLVYRKLGSDVTVATRMRYSPLRPSTLTTSAS